MTTYTLEEAIDLIDDYFEAEVEEDRDLDEVYNQLEEANILISQLKDIIEANI
jgi:5-bromo-4-chloroindolyl phosphate hydrolysis protein